MKLFTGVVCLFALCAVTFAQSNVNGQAGANTQQAGVNTQTGVQQPNTGSGLIPGAGVDAQVPGVAGLGVNLGRKRRDADSQGAVVNGQLPGTQVAGSAQQGAVQAPVGSQVGVQTSLGGAGLGVGRKRRQVAGQAGANTRQAGLNSQTGVQQRNTGSGLIPGAGLGAQVPGVAGLGVNLGRKRRDADTQGVAVNGQLPGTQQEACNKVQFKRPLVARLEFKHLLVVLVWELVVNGAKLTVKLVSRVITT
uniref:Uncharacterized protein n=1 Tax=Plectus sambesii TaxID=2011161 RepID=A0A914XIE8_9BILA